MNYFYSNPRGSALNAIGLLKRPIGLVLFGVWLQLFCTSAIGQIKVTSLVKDKHSLITASEVIYTPYKTQDPEHGLKRKQLLAEGDELSCTSGNVTVELQSVDGNATYDLSGQFRITVLNPRRIYQWAGKANVRASVPTEALSGEVVMGSEGTDYAMKISRAGAGPVQECLVYEGRVRVVSSDPLRGPLNSLPGSRLVTGEKWIIAEGELDRGPRIQRVTDADLKEGATVYAEADAGKATLRLLDGRTSAMEGLILASGPSFDEAYDVFYKAHLAVLNEPTNSKTRLTLAIAELNFHLPNDAIYQTRKAEQFSLPADRSFRATIAMVSGAAFTQAGQKASAESEFNKAFGLDPAVFAEENLKRYGLANDVAATIITWSPQKVPT